MVVALCVLIVWNTCHYNYRQKSNSNANYERNTDQTPAKLNQCKTLRNPKYKLYVESKAWNVSFMVCVVFDATNTSKVFRLSKINLSFVLLFNVFWVESLERDRYKNIQRQLSCLFEYIWHLVYIAISKAKTNSNYWRIDSKCHCSLCQCLCFVLCVVHNEPLQILFVQKRESQIHRILCLNTNCVLEATYVVHMKKRVSNWKFDQARGYMQCKLNCVKSNEQRLISREIHYFLNKRTLFESTKHSFN